MGKAIDKSFVVPARFIFLMWLSFSFATFFNFDLMNFGIFPRKLGGMIGILTSPLIHVDIVHITSNTFPILFLGTALYLLFDKIAQGVFLQSYFYTGILVWLFGRPLYHVGASGLIFALASFLIFFGIFRRDFKSIIISIIVLIIYNSIFYGVLPTQERISWESHLIGAIVGIVLAYRYSKTRSVSS